jgi:MoxR-like ATPase
MQLKTTQQVFFDTQLAQKFKMYNFKKHLLIEGEKGVGKTYFVNLWCEANRVSKVMVGGHEQFDSIDFLGHYIPTEDRSLIWKDGALTEAFRVASQKKRVVLVIDEILRIPSRELNILLSTLIPWKGKYTLRTGRAIKSDEGVAVEEVINVDTRFLWVVGTTNIGKQYNNHDGDEAFFDRFRVVRKEANSNEIDAILFNSIKTKGFSQNAYTAMKGLYAKVQELAEYGELESPFNLRFLSETIQFSSQESDIKSYLLDLVPHIVKRERDGQLNSAQSKLINKLINKYFA